MFRMGNKAPEVFSSIARRLPLPLRERVGVRGFRFLTKNP